jgi:hypothetical protein
MKKFSLKLWPRSTTDQAEQSEEPSVVDGITLGEGKRFGIKSYLHQFYLSSPTIDELESPGAWQVYLKILELNSFVLGIYCHHHQCNACLHWYAE